MGAGRAQDKPKSTQFQCGLSCHIQDAMTWWREGLWTGQARAGTSHPQAAWPQTWEPEALLGSWPAGQGEATQDGQEPEQGRLVPRVLSASSRATEGESQLEGICQGADPRRAGRGAAGGGPAVAKSQSARSALPGSTMQPPSVGLQGHPELAQP